MRKLDIENLGIVATSLVSGTVTGVLLGYLIIVDFSEVIENEYSYC